MKTLLVVLVIFLGVVITGKAQNDPKAKAILDKVSEKTKAYTSIQVNFSFTLQNEEADINDEQKGEIKIKGLKYKLTMMGATTYFNGKTIHTYLEDANEVNISAPDEEMEEMLDPAKLFTIYEDGFTYKLKKKEGTTAIIDLFPDSEESNYSKVELTINTSTMQINGAKLHGEDGNLYLFKVLSFKTDVALPDNLFEFDASKHEGVYINDMR